MIPSDSKDKSIPLIHFFDVNNDGMVDQVFYHDKQLYIFYNQHKRREFEMTILKESQNLCLNEPLNAVENDLF